MFQLFKKPDINKHIEGAKKWVHCAYESSHTMYSLVPESDAFVELSRSFKQKQKSFVEQVVDIIREKNLRDSAVYKAAHIDRRLFSKIMSDVNYKPSKDTAIAIAIGLKLNDIEAIDLLSRAGYTFSRSIKRDLIIEYFFREREYDMSVINIVLDQLGEKPIGR